MSYIAGHSQKLYQHNIMPYTAGHSIEIIPALYCHIQLGKVGLSMYFCIQGLNKYRMLLIFLLNTWHTCSCLSRIESMQWNSEHVGVW